MYSQVKSCDFCTKHINMNCYHHHRHRRHCYANICACNHPFIHSCVWLNCSTCPLSSLSLRSNFIILSVLWIWGFFLLLHKTCIVLSGKKNQVVQRNYLKYIQCLQGLEFFHVYCMFLLVLGEICFNSKNSNPCVYIFCSPISSCIL